MLGLYRFLSFGCHYFSQDKAVATEIGLVKSSIQMLMTNYLCTWMFKVYVYLSLVAVISLKTKQGLPQLD